MKAKALTFLVFLAILGAVLNAWAEESVLLKAMSEELSRSFKNLKGKEFAPLYYLQYEVTEVTTHTMRASYGAIQTDDTERSRFLDVAVRVGDYSLDNTHELRGGGGYGFYMARDTRIPLVDDADAIKTSLWLATDKAFKNAQERYIKVKSDKAVKVEEEDPSPDFSRGKKHLYISEPVSIEFDSEKWKPILREVSSRFKKYPYVMSSTASITVQSETKYIVDSEGTRLQFGQNAIHVTLHGIAKADDGMELTRARRYQARDFGETPPVELLIAAVDSIADELDRLRKAPLVEPYIGPAILMGKASGVFFHEIFGHRIEGHRQKRSAEGQTFTKKVGQKILPDFISVYDDPSLERFKDRPVMGHYQYDDEGVPSQKVVVVENGVLRNFLMSRSPIEGFPQSNGHGRKQHGRKAVSRQGNLIVRSSRTVSFPELRTQLIEECKRQGKPYGLMFEDISGGYTMMARWTPQAFKVIPLLVYRVYADGRPDEVVRGVDIVGTPLTCFAKIINAADDDDIFNGRCGAESGWVPVSAISPSILVSEIEVEKKAKEQDRPPVLPPPDSKGAPAVAEDALMKAMDDELRRSLKKLKMEKLERPYYLEYTIKDVEAIFVQASFGAITRSDEGRDRYLNVDLRVGDYHFDNTNYAAGGSGFSFGGRPAAMVTDNDYDALRHQLWLATDNAYKSALEAISRKRAYVKTRRFEEMPDDMCRVKSYTSIQHRAKLTTSKEVWDERVARISEMFRKYPTIKESRVSFFAAASNQYFLNSEGSKHLRPGVLYGLEVTATAQAEDGMELSDFVTFYSRSGEGPAPLSEIEKSVRAMASSLEKKAKAPTIDDYTGPVLFVGQASGEFFQQLLGKNVSNPRKPMMENEMLQAVVPGGRLTGKLGKRVLPRFVDVSDDPGLKEWEGKELIGQYLVDDDGVPARGVQIVDDGKLVGLLMSRIPTRKVQESNGHGRAEGAYVVGRISNMIVESERAKSADDLLEEFKSMCKDFDLDYGIIVEKMSLPRFAKKRRSMSYLFRQRQEQGSFLSDPVTVYKVDLKTGKKELVRGCQFSGVTLRMLRDIIDTGGDQYVHNFLSSLVPLASGIPASVVSPSILIEEVELKKVSGEMPKSPILPNPYFD